jgi:hypothetical protein
MTNALTALVAQAARDAQAHRDDAALAKLHGNAHGERLHRTLAQVHDWFATEIPKAAHAAPQQEQDIWTPEYLKAYGHGLKDAESSGVLQAVLDALNGTLDPSTQIADHPNVKFAQMQRLKLLDEGRAAAVGRPDGTAL